MRISKLSSEWIHTHPSYREDIKACAIYSSACLRSHPSRHVSTALHILARNLQKYLKKVHKVGKGQTARGRTPWGLGPGEVTVVEATP